MIQLVCQYFQAVIPVPQLKLSSHLQDGRKGQRQEQYESHYLDKAEESGRKIIKETKSSARMKVLFHFCFPSVYCEVIFGMKTRIND